MESFAETFTLLSVSLPQQLQLGCSSVAFVANGELIQLTEYKQMTGWKVESEAHFRVLATDRQYRSYHPPLIVGTEVYIANGWRVEKWSLEVDRLV